MFFGDFEVVAPLLLLLEELVELLVLVLPAVDWSEVLPWASCTAELTA
ncbi:MAG TPA: hypothetical protein VLG48_13985 [Candidatus Methylomirabilis sp.]|nr:hypothetical protein [Candidatus Methylomirabilis sp.]